MIRLPCRLRAYALLACLVCVTAHSGDFADLPFADLGTTRVLDGGHAGLVLVLGDAATTARAQALAQAIAQLGRSATIVDIDTFLARSAAAHVTCIDAGTLLDVYAQQVQQNLRFPRFGSPALIGIGRGASFLPLLLARTRAGVFAAGVSAGAAAPLMLPAPPCGAGAEAFGWVSPERPITLPAGIATATPWTRSVSSDAGAAIEALDALLARPGASDAIADLPLIELPQPQGGRAPWIVIVLSGDGGWANIDRDIAEELGAHGIAVLGWNSLRYFWEAKAPDTAAADLARVVRHYTLAWRKPRVLLLGYSLGADVLPFMAARAPAEVRAALAGMVLLNPASAADFQFHIADWLGAGDAAPYPLLPEMRRLSGVPVLCLYAADDEDAGLCPQLAARAGTTVLSLPGDHHFNGDYAGIARIVIEHFPLAP